MGDPHKFPPDVDPTAERRGTRRVPAELLCVLACPECKGALVHIPAGLDGPDEALFCPTSRLKYRIDDGIPVLLVDEAERLGSAAVERLADALAGAGRAR